MVDKGANGGISTDVTPNDYKVATKWNDDASLYDVTVTATEVPTHYNNERKLGGWVGVGFPFTASQYYYVGAGKYKDGALTGKTFTQQKTVDGYYGSDNAKPYLEVFLPAEKYGNYFVAISDNADGSDPTVYNVDQSDNVTTAHPYALAPVDKGTAEDPRDEPINLDEYSVSSKWNNDLGVLDVSVSASDVPYHYNDDHQAGCWVGVGFPFTASQYYYVGAGKYEDGALAGKTFTQQDTVDGYYGSDNAKPYLEVFLPAEKYGNYFVAISDSQDGSDPTVYNVDQSENVTLASKRITANPNLAGGSLKFSASDAVPGEPVIVTPVPDSGYSTASVTQTGALSMDDNGDGTWTLAVGADDVTVSATFTAGMGATGSQQTTSSVAELTSDEISGALYFDSLSAALAASVSQTNATVKLLKADEVVTAQAIQGGKGLTLDLDGKELKVTTAAASGTTPAKTGSLSFTAAKTTVQNGTLTISGKPASGSPVSVAGAATEVVINNVAITSDAAPAVAVTGGAKLTLSGTTGITATQKGEANGANGAAVVSVAGESTFSIDGTGTISTYVDGSTSGWAGIKAEGASTVNVGDAEATAVAATPTFDTMYAAIETLDTAEANIYGGTFSATRATNSADDAVTALYAGGKSTMNVSAASVTGKNSAVATASDAATLNLKAGTFKYTGGNATGTNNAAINPSPSAIVSITGGEYGDSASKRHTTLVKAQSVKGGTFYEKPGLADTTSGKAVSTDEVAQGYTYDVATTTLAKWDVKKNLADVTFEQKPAVAYTGSAQTPVFKASAWTGTEDTEELAKIAEGTVFDMKYYQQANYSDAGSDQVTSGVYYPRATSLSSDWMGTQNLASFAVAGASLDDVKIQLSADGTNWFDDGKLVAAYNNGTAVQPQVRVTINDVVIPAGTTQNPTFNYSVSYTNATGTGEATAVVTPSANTGKLLAAGTTNQSSRAVKYTIDGATELPAPQFAKTESDVVYTATGAQDTEIVLPQLTVGTAILGLGTNYNVYLQDASGKYLDAAGATTTKTALAAGTTMVKVEDAGTYTFTYEGIGQYSAEKTKTVTYTVKPLSISDTTKATIALTYTPALANGAVQYAFSGVTAALTAGNVSATPATGSLYKVSDTVTYPLNTNDVEVSPTAMYASGAQKFTVKGKGNFTGAQDVAVNITPLSIKGATAAADYTVTVSASKEFNGEDQTPATVTVQDKESGPHTLVEGRDYRVSYYLASDASKTPVTPKAVGKYKVVVTGIGGYAAASSVLEADWEITGKSISKIADKDIKLAYNGGSKGADGNYTKFKFTGEEYDLTKLMTITDGDATLVYGKDYTLSPTAVSKGQSVMIFGAGNYSGTTTKQINFTTAVLSESATAKLAKELTFTPQNGTREGKVLTPEFTVENNAGVALKADSDYQMTIVEPKTFESDGTTPKTWNDADWDNPVTTVEDAGAYKAVFKGLGTYSSQAPAKVGDDPNIEIAFEVAPFDLSATSVEFPAKADVDVTNDRAFFTGAAIEPTVRDKIDPSALTVTYKAASGDVKIPLLQKASKKALNDFSTTGFTDAGDYKVTVKGEGNFTGTVDTDYEFSVSKLTKEEFDKLVAAGKAAVEFENPKGSGVYTDTMTGAAGVDQSVRVILKDGGSVYTVPASTYAVATENNAAGSSQGTVKVTFNATGNFAEGTELTKSYNISDTDLSATADLTFVGGDSADFVAGGVAVSPQIVDKAYGSAVTGSQSFVYYKGEEKEATVYNAGTTKLDAGTYKFVGYTDAAYGTVTATFTVKPLDITGQSVTVDNETYTIGTKFTGKQYTYTGKALKPAVRVGALKAVGDANGSAKYTEKDADYKVEYANNTNAGDAKITVTGLNNYAGSSFEIPFEIGKADFNNFAKIYRVEGDTATYSATYTGSEVKPAVTVTDNESVPTKELVEGKDYELAYANNVNTGASTDAPGAPTVYAVPLDTTNFKADSSKYAKVTFTIKAADLSSDKLDVKATFTGTTYTGEAVTPKMAITYTAADGTVNELVSGIDYTTPVFSGDAVNAGETGTAMTVGLGNYTGTFRPTFTVEKAEAAIEAPASFSKTYGDVAFEIGAKVAKGEGALAYAPDNSGVVSVDAAGKVSILKAGSGKVSVTLPESANYKEASATVAVSVAKAASTVKVADVKATYTGKAVAAKATATGSKGAVTVKYYSDKGATKAISAPVNAGTYYAKATVAADANYNAASSNVATITIAKAANTVTAKGKTLKAKKLSAKKLKKKAQGYKAKKYVAVSGAQGKVTYKLASAKKGKKAMKAKALKKAFKVNAKTGKLTVGKGVKKGAYTLTVQVNAAGDANHAAKAVKATAKVVVKK